MKMTTYSKFCRNLSVALSVLTLSAAGLPTAVQASSTSANFNVNLTLTSSCSVATPNDINLTYQSGQVLPSTGVSTLSVNCTFGMPYTLSMGAAGGAAGAGFGSQTNDNISKSAASGGAGLSYSLDVTPPIGVGLISLLPNAHLITATVAGGQMSSCATATCTYTAPKTVFVNY